MKTLATDLDGTLYLDSTIIEGVKSAYDLLVNNNYYIYHTTNNSSQSTEVLSKKLSVMLDKDIEIASVVTPLVVLNEFLKDKNLSIFVYGSDQIKNYISNISDTVSDPEKSDLIIIGRVETPSEDDLNKISEIIKSGVNGATLNKDLTYPISSTEFKPGNGQIAKYVETLSGKELNSFGKEGNLYSQYFVDNNIQLDYVIGDRVDTDIIFGKNVNAETILVESSINNHMSTSLADKIFINFPEFVSSII